VDLPRGKRYVVEDDLLRVPPLRATYAQNKRVVRSADHSLVQPPGKAPLEFTADPARRFYTVVWLNFVRRPKSQRGAR
jgi:hypothetical protein